MDNLLVPSLLDHAEPILRLIVAAVLGGVVGLERERSGKPAGFRTHLLICLGAALLTELSIAVAQSADSQAGFRSDPGRIAAQIVSGIGFLGAGTIIQARGAVIGLTTAASIWVVAAIGMAMGAAEYVAAFSTTALVIIALRLLGRLEDRMSRADPQERTIEVELKANPALLAEVERTIAGGGNEVELVSITKGEDTFVAAYRVIGTEAGRDRAVAGLLERAGLRRIAVR